MKLDRNISLQEYILQRQFGDHLQTTSFGFKGYSGPSWELEMDLPRASMLPEQAGVSKVMADPTKRAVSTLIQGE